VEMLSSPIILTLNSAKLFSCYNRVHPLCFIMTQPLTSPSLSLTAKNLCTNGEPGWNFRFHFFCLFTRDCANPKLIFLKSTGLHSPFVNKQEKVETKIPSRFIVCTQIFGCQNQGWTGERLGHNKIEWMYFVVTTEQFD